MNSGFKSATRTRLDNAMGASAGTVDPDELRSELDQALDRYHSARSVIADTAISLSDMREFTRQLRDKLRVAELQARRQSRIIADSAAECARAYERNAELLARIAELESAPKRKARK